MGPAPKIMREVIARINELFTLPNNWDSYGGRPISFTAAMAAISWLDDYSEDKLPVPSVVPGSDGSVQLEWHIHGIDLEVLFPPSGTPEFVYEDHNTNTQQDGFLALENQDGRVFVQQIAAQTDE